MRHVAAMVDELKRRHSYDLWVASCTLALILSDSTGAELSGRQWLVRTLENDLCAGVELPSPRSHGWVAAVPPPGARATYRRRPSRATRSQAGWDPRPDRARLGTHGRRRPRAPALRNLLSTPDDAGDVSPEDASRHVASTDMTPH